MRTKRNPFHETIARTIRRCPTKSIGEMLRLFQLIEETDIKKGHDEIIAAIDEFFNFPGAEKWAHEICQVKRSLLEQKQEARNRSGRYL